jgi:hypothetical protein
MLSGLNAELTLKSEFIQHSAFESQHYDFGLFAPYFERPWLAARHADGVERATDDVVANAREILDAAAADEHERVLLQVVADAGM